VASVTVTAANEPSCAALRQALEIGKGVLHVLSGIENLAEAMQGGQSTAGIGALQVFSTQRACPVCGTSYAELDPRCSPTTASTAGAPIAWARA
jgi:excinuclease ABC subunit A